MIAKCEKCYDPINRPYVIQDKYSTETGLRVSVRRQYCQKCYNKHMEKNE